jgi:hypothetical protein
MKSKRDKVIKRKSENQREGIQSRENGGKSNRRRECEIEKQKI